jgi:hypothetical protein
MLEVSLYLIDLLVFGSFHRQLSPQLLTLIPQICVLHSQFVVQFQTALVCLSQSISVDADISTACFKILYFFLQSFYEIN